ncbi:unnamed protein product [Bursaphelenchus xylophilus]|uniref:(pine wood nematode) hypothetical protein n=1 Tax=Bursaphelenchus xylophilus TaxID=6326 RepID=A0A1I7SA91_BURXY|nr:unnamed protein product [Bursaphelenchus xylophilus]CAG9084173.1 unnamed protein product [Bursaphelenchus xylophilus]
MATTDPTTATNQELEQLCRLDECCMANNLEAIPIEFTRFGNLNYQGLSVKVSAESQFSYGTAGFRYRDDVMGFIVYRVALWTCLRVRTLSFYNLGLMITASHNPIGDNGVKIVGAKGEMLTTELQQEVQDLINLNDEDFHIKIKEMWTLVAKKDIYTGLHIAWDTRPSSPCLALAALRAAQQCNVKAIAHGLLTTPQLHYVVMASNMREYPLSSITQKFTNAAKSFLQLCPEPPVLLYQRDMVAVDCANGVGGIWIGHYFKELPQGFLKTAFNNTECFSNGLNKDCGADFVKIKRSLPTGFEGSPPYCRCASLDGDADRLVYFFRDNDFQLTVLDGDHISALFAKFLIDHIRAIPAVQEANFSVGVVQTAYANGCSTRYFGETLQMAVVRAKTGVQNLHTEATKFDVGIYFEANGHGTVFFSSRFKSFLCELREVEPQNAYLGRLLAFTEIINDVVGDGIADLLAVEVILRLYNWNVLEWQSNTYTNAPSVQLKVSVADRSLYQCKDDDETSLVLPEGLQEKIDSILAEYPNSRGFIRPSGTENILRVYAEAESSALATELGERLEGIVRV